LRDIEQEIDRWLSTYVQRWRCVDPEALAGVVLDPMKDEEVRAFIAAHYRELWAKVPERLKREHEQARARLDAGPMIGPPPSRVRANAQADHERILRIIHEVGKAMEQHPGAHRGKSEEELRDHILTTLRTHFPNTTGESFNYRGKTDILVRRESENIFVGECKIWSGQKDFLAAIDQLLGYLTWRDSRAALVIFVRRKDFSAVLGGIKTETPKHPCFVQTGREIGHGWLSYGFRLPDDPGVAIELAVLVFHFPD
jgi:hypothetical protein